MLKKAKPNAIRRKIYPDREEARRDVFNYIEMFYNPKMSSWLCRWCTSNLIPGRLSIVLRVHILGSDRVGEILILAFFPVDRSKASAGAASIVEPPFELLVLRNDLRPEEEQGGGEFDAEQDDDGGGE